MLALKDTSRNLIYRNKIQESCPSETKLVN